MPTSLSEFGAGYNARAKVYTNGCTVFTYCNQYCFHIPDIIPKKKKPCPSSEIDFTLFSVSDFAHFFDDHHIFYSFESLSYFFYHSFSFCVVFDCLYSDFVLGNSLDKWFPENIKKKELNKRMDSVKRSRDKIYDLVMCNEWNYFFTGTLGDTAFDPTSAKAALRPLQNWLSNAVKRFGLKYILVAELQPKSKHIHFHGFINDALDVVDSGTKLYKHVPKPIKDSTALKRGLSLSDGHVVYNVPQWKFGFTTAIKSYNGSQSCAQYIMKYVTKDNKEIFGRYYWSSRNLCRSPSLYFDNVDYNSLPIPTYSIPRTNRELKYYTFFPGQTDFHFNDNDDDRPKSELFDSSDGVLYFPPSPSDLALANSAAILSDLEDFETLHDFSLEGFEEV
ncbi:MAG: hypothetical protein ACI4J0_02445 [Huintestinicola sp.]|uniref:rolling circle replication-associated protein n=1 Tax=Huintestinicola sp. TaxID=2981661 RepID=UPI003F052718